MDQSQSQDTWTSIKRLAYASWDATDGCRLRTFGFIALFISAYAIDLVIPWAVGWILDVYVKQGFTMTAFNLSLWYIGAYIALRMVQSLFHHIARYLQGTAAFLARFKKLEEVFTGMLSFPLKWHVHHHSGENLSRLNRSVGAVEQMIGHYIWQIIEGVVKFALASAALFWLDAPVALSVLILGGLTVVGMVLFNTKYTRNVRKNNKFYDRLNRTCVDYLNNIITVKTLKLEKPATSYLTAQKNDGLRISRKIWKYQELKWGTVDLGSSLVMGTALIVYFYTHVLSPRHGAFDVAEVYVLMNYLERMFGSIASFTGYYGGIIEAGISYDDASSVLQESSALTVRPRPSRIPGDWDTIRISNVEFAYGDTPSLTIPEFDLKRGEKIALVGPSGGGKTTLLKILGGMVQVQRAEVRSLDGKEFDLDDIAGVSLLVPQEPEVFSETVRFNLTFGEPYSDEELLKALQLCRIDYLLDRLPNRWESNLEEAGLNISVGERQRLALARGILRIPGKDILLMDEPTSSLDPMTEKQVFHGIFHHYTDRTVITACHRLALVPMFDKVVYIKNGRIEEVGSFPELRAAGKAFAAAWEDYERKVVRGESQAA